MHRPSFANLSAFATALLIVALCGLLSTPTFADRDNDRSRGHDSGDKADARDSKGSSHDSASSDRGSSRSGRARDNTPSRAESSRSSGPSVDFSRSNRSDSGRPSVDSSRSNRFDSRDSGSRSFGRQDTSTSRSDNQPRSYWGSSSSRSDRSKTDDTPKVESRSTDTRSDSRSFGRQDSSSSRSGSDSSSYWSRRTDQNRSNDAPKFEPRTDSNTRDDHRTFQRSDSNRDDHAGRTDSNFRRDDHNSRPSTGGRDYRSSGGSGSHFSDRDSWPHGYRAPTFSSGFYHYSERPRYRPARFGFYIFDNYDPFYCRRSVYFHFGFFPYISYTRVFVRPYEVVSYYDAPIYFGDDGYYLNRHLSSGLDDTLSDIRKAWIDGRPDLIQDHVSSSDQIAILLDGSYDYSVNADDYMQMTSDAIDQMQTVSFTWQGVRRRSDGDYTAFAKHTYRDDSGDRKTVYVSYTLERSGGDYTIDEVGSSSSSLF